MYQGEQYLAQKKKEMTREQKSDIKSAIKNLRNAMKHVKPQNITEEDGRRIKEAAETLEHKIA